MAEHESVLLPNCWVSSYFVFADLSFFPVPIVYDMFAAGIVSEQKLLKKKDGKPEKGSIELPT